MSPVQTVYTERMARALPGQIQGSDYNTGTGICEEEYGLGFGRPVSQGTAEQGVVAAATLASFMGITVRDVALGIERAPEDVIPEYANLSYLKQGQIAVIAGADGIVPGDPVHFHGDTGVWLKSGQQGPIVGARYKSAGNTGDIVIIELQFK